MSKATLLDIAKLNGNDTVVGLIEEVIQSAPEAQLVPFRTIRGTTYSTVMRTGLPSVGFRDANDGFAPTKSTFKNKLVECYIFGGRIEVDKAVADAHEDGAEAFQALEASGIMEAALQRFGKQFYYGTVVDGKGFPGLKSVTPKDGVTANSDPLTVDATGSTATTASSVYAVTLGERDVIGVSGREGAFEMPDFRIGDITGVNSEKITGYISEICAWLGLQMVNENSVRRIINVTADSGKGLTDILLAKLLATFPVGKTPSAIMLSRRSRSQLQASRTVVLQGSGRGRPDQPTLAPLPTEYDGIPLVVTDSIADNDAINS